jgi:hypothetical protein
MKRMNIIAWLHNKHPHLLEELMLLDRATDGAFLGHPEHTLSYNIAMAAKGGNKIAKELCGALNQLSPDHCASAIAMESTQKWRDATGEAG